MRPILEVRNISKKYRIRHLSGGYLSFRERIQSAFQFKKNELEDFWALKDVAFDVEIGQSVGIIGPNGAGKSTLLKILSKITRPTEGVIITRGRIASLLEVGTGFHPELSGRENIFFNGSLLGMKRRMIEATFDEIVDFSGTEKFLDVPLKHYSSGMQLRLAFAVAAFLEPEILIIDEVLAVGDAEFQKKCLGKMQDITKSGRTILFVSHNMAAVQNLCTRGVLLSGGSVQAIGSISSVIETYQALSPQASTLRLFTDNDLWLSGFSAESERQTPIMTKVDGNFIIEIESKIELADIFIGVGVNDPSGTRLFTLFSKFHGKTYSIVKGRNLIICHVKELPLKPGIYYAEIYAGDGMSKPHLYYNHGLRFEVLPSKEVNFLGIPDASQGHFLMNESWN